MCAMAVLPNHGRPPWQTRSQAGTRQEPRQSRGCRIRDQTDLLGRAGFQRQVGLKHHELADRPDIVQMGHIESNKLGRNERLMLQGAWENQYNNVSIERSHIGGAVLEQTAISVGGIAVDLQTARFWEDWGLLKPGTVAAAPRIVK